MDKGRVLIIDDDPMIHYFLTPELQKEGFEVLSAVDGEKGIESFLKNMPDLVICDIQLPGINGMELLKKFQEADPSIPVIMLAGQSSEEIVSDAIKLGAYEYIVKPMNLRDLWPHVIKLQKVIEIRTLRQEVNQLRHKTEDQNGNENIIGVTPQMRELVSLIDKIASSDAPTILLQGESGSGKNYVARMIHEKSKRAHFPFTEINCASLPETLIESELFGHEKGAFTDAKQMKRGLFEVARGGTIFLDEVAEMSIPIQAKLLHAVDNHRFRRLGGVEDIETDVRLITATNINLKNAVEDHRFRQDLYFRLQLIPIYIPPLRERAEDIPLLVQHFIDKFNKEYRKKIEGMSPEVEVLLKLYRWPGNVRELKNVVERIAILENEVLIQANHLPQEIRLGLPTPATDYPMPASGINLEMVEKQFLVQALTKTAWNQSRAAKLLGITRHTLRYRMEKFGLHS